MRKPSAPRPEPSNRSEGTPAEEIPAGPTGSAGDRADWGGRPGPATSSAGSQCDSELSQGYGENGFLQGGRTPSRLREADRW